MVPNSSLMVVSCVKTTTDHKCGECQWKKSHCTKVRISMSTLYHRLTIQVPKKYQHYARQLTILEATIAATTPACLLFMLQRCVWSL